MSEDLTGRGSEDDLRDEEEPKRKPPERSTSTRRPQSEVRAERKVQGALKQLARIVKRRDVVLGNIIEEDADKMGTLLAHGAAKWPGPLQKLIGIVIELLEPLDAFGRTAAHLVKKVREARAEARQEWEEEQAVARPWDTSQE